MIILMGVAGSGKSTVGRLLAARLGWLFWDADDFHSPQNVAKMGAGQPLTDDDRRPWLTSLRSVIDELEESGENAVLACSALKRSYRAVLTEGTRNCRWVYLKADPELCRRRLEERQGHFFDPRLLADQFKTLEEPKDALTLAAEEPPKKLVAKIISAFNLGFSD